MSLAPRNTALPLACLGLVLPVFADLQATLIENTAVAGQGPEYDVPRGARKTFDLLLQTNADWAAATVRVRVLPAGQGAGLQIRHALGQPAGAAAAWGNLSSPLSGTPLDSSTLLYDTFLAGPPVGDAGDPNAFHPYGTITTLGVDVPGDGAAGRVSTAREIGARDPQDHPIALPWFDTQVTPAGSFLGARITFVPPAGPPIHIGSSAAGALASIEGRVSDAENTPGVPFHFFVTYVPELQTSGLLLMLGGLAGRMRRRPD